MNELTFSLVVTTRGRCGEVERLLQSLTRQSFKSFEVIIVDQNDDDRLVGIVTEYGQVFALRHIRTSIRGCSPGRNVGMHLCQGQVIGFPDDDCWYAPRLLESVADLLNQHPEWKAVTGRERSSEEAGDSPRFDLVGGPVTKKNIWRRHIAFTAFFRKEAVGDLLYDPTLGVGSGTIWGAGDETDFLLRFMAKGNHVEYQPSLVVFHPDWGQGPFHKAAIVKGFRYGMGMGRLLQMHQFPLPMVLKRFARPVVGGAYTLLLGRPRKALYHWAIFIGRSAGWTISWLSELSNGRRNHQHAVSGGTLP